MTFAIVIPTTGRPSLHRLLAALAASRGPRPQWTVVVDDSAARRGPAAARNSGWRAVDADWIVFLDDDVVVPPSWPADLAADLSGADQDVAAVAGRISVPLPADRRPTDWERNTAGLSTAKWITADIAYRRDVLAEVGGFDERFPRAFREDADLALRVMSAGYRLTVGRRSTTHPVRPAGWWASVVQQRGNADDALMTRLHGRDWRKRAGAPLGRRPMHLATTAALLLGLRRRAALSAWAALTARFAWLRIKPGPRDLREVARMVSTSAVIPPAAVWHWLRGLARHRRAKPWPDAVLVDRDGTIVHDVPHNGDAAQVAPVPGAAQALDRLRAAGIPVGVITNQSGVARGLLSSEQVDAVNARIDELLGPFAVWQVCPHGPQDGCGCRKPQPGLVVQAAATLHVRPERVVVIGDIGTDVEAARAAGAAGLLVPTAATRPEEIDAAPAVFATLGDAVDSVLGER